jgi:multicomponent Na+:H+ antiporter subunit C
MIDLFLDRYIYLFVLVLLAIGLYGVLAKGDLVKKVIGLTIFSTAIYLFFIEGSLQLDATAPVIDERGSDPALYVDPLPHLLILTAIVVGVGVVGVALSLLVRIYRSHGSLDEAVVAERLARGDTSLPGGNDPEDGDVDQHPTVGPDDAAEDDAPEIAVDLDEPGGSSP